MEGKTDSELPPLYTCAHSPAPHLMFTQNKINFICLGFLKHAFLVQDALKLSLVLSQPPWY